MRAAFLVFYGQKEEIPPPWPSPSRVEGVRKRLENTSKYQHFLQEIERFHVEIVDLFDECFSGVRIKLSPPRLSRKINLSPPNRTHQISSSEGRFLSALVPLSVWAQAAKQRPSYRRIC